MEFPLLVVKLLQVLPRLLSVFSSFTAVIVTARKTRPAVLHINDAGIIQTGALVTVALTIRPAVSETAGALDAESIAPVCLFKHE